MKNLTAAQAYRLSQKKEIDQLQEIQEAISNAAIKGEKSISVGKYLKPEVVQTLKDRGFNVTPGSSISIQKDNHYYSIDWKNPPPAGDGFEETGSVAHSSLPAL